MDDAVAFVVARRAALGRFDDYVELALALDEPTATSTERGLVFHLDAIIESVCRELWAREIYLGASVIAELVFDAAKNARIADPLRHVLDFFRDRRVARDGLIVFGLHGFGVLSAGLLRGLTGQHISIANPRAGYVVVPQTNQLDRCIDVLENARLALGVGKRVPADSIEHYHRSRAAWLTSNPLLIARVSHLAGSKFENQGMLMWRVRAMSGLLAMLAAFQPSTTGGAPYVFSTSMMNNWETLDIHHYVTLANHPNVPSALEGDCVPINVAREQVYELSDLGVQIDPRYVRRRRTLFARVEDAVVGVHRAYVEGTVRRRTGAQVQLARKLFLSMDYFRRTYRRASGPWSTAVTLATAMEMLLTDGWEGAGVSDRMRRRARRLLAGISGTRALQTALLNLYDVRSEYVHHGVSSGSYDLALVRQAYVHCFVGLAAALPRVRPQSNSPVRDICGR